MSCGPQTVPKMTAYFAAFVGSWPCESALHVKNSKRQVEASILVSVRHNLGVVAVFGFFLFIFLVFFFFDWFQFDGIEGSHFEVGSALRAGEDFAFIYLVFFHIQTCIALRTIKHNRPLFCLRPL